ncbi:MAG: hypothetical protein WAJ95_19365, partial [Desulfobacterales bacterium]
FAPSILRGVIIEMYTPSDPIHRQDYISRHRIGNNRRIDRPFDRLASLRSRLTAIGLSNTGIKRFSHCPWTAF